MSAPKLRLYPSSITHPMCFIIQQPHYCYLCQDTFAATETTGLQHLQNHRTNKNSKDDRHLWGMKFHQALNVTREKDKIPGKRVRNRREQGVFPADLYLTTQACDFFHNLLWTNHVMVTVDVHARRTLEGICEAYAWVCEKLRDQHRLRKMKPPCMDKKTESDLQKMD